MLKLALVIRPEWPLSRATKPPVLVFHSAAKGLSVLVEATNSPSGLNDTR